MSEQIILEEPGVFVSTERVAVPGRTYAIGQIASVAKGWRGPDRSASLLLLILAASLLVVSVAALKAASLPAMQDLASFFRFVAAWAGAGCIAFLVGGSAIWRTAEESHRVVLGFGSSHVEALASRDEGFVTRVASAIIEAIVNRGA